MRCAPRAVPASVPREIRDLRALLDAMRLIKDDSEVEAMRRAAAISSAGHARAMRHCRPGMAEYELEAELTHEFRRRGSAATPTPIVAGGANACVLHYIENDRILPESALVLIDAGCELDGYAADITRTFPGQRPLLAGTARLLRDRARRAGGRHRRREARCFLHGLPRRCGVRVLAQGMLDLKLLTGSVDSVIESDTYRRFYAPHRPLARPRRA